MATSYLCVDVGDAVYGIDAKYVVEVSRSVVTTAVPGTPLFVAGVTNHRGKILPVVDAGDRLRVRSVRASDTEFHTVFLEGASRRAALMVDGIREILAIDEAEIDEAPGILNGSEADLYNGIATMGEEIVGLIDVEGLCRFEIDEVIFEGDVDLIEEKERAVDRSTETVGRTFAVLAVGDEEYAILTDHVIEAVPKMEMDRPGDMPAYVSGLVNHRGYTVPVVDLQLRFGLESAVAGRGRLVVLEAGGYRYAVSVDAVVELISLSEDDLRPVPEVVHGDDDYIQAIAIPPGQERVIAIADPERIIRPEDGARLKKLEGAMSEKSSASGKSTDADVELVVFRSGSIGFALASAEVSEITRLPVATRVPYAPDFVDGVFQRQGRVLALIDLRRRLGIEGEEVGGKLLIVENDGDSFGLKVGELEQIRRVPKSSISLPPKIVQGVEKHFLAGLISLGEETILLLDAAVILDRTVHISKTKG